MLIQQQSGVSEYTCRFSRGGYVAILCGQYGRTVYRQNAKNRVQAVFRQVSFIRRLAFASRCNNRYLPVKPSKINKSFTLRLPLNKLHDGIIIKPLKHIAIPSPALAMEQKSIR
ncbi:hypothetical protein E0I03_15030 [Dickeya dadantii]|nr:hypothetical protein [Dickeya dadantii]